MDKIDELYQRVDWAERTFRAIVEGKKPLIDPESPDQSWLYEQLRKMYTDNFISENPEQYIMTPDRENDLDDFGFYSRLVNKDENGFVTDRALHHGDLMSQGITYIHPLSAATQKSQHEAVGALRRIGVKNFTPLGSLGLRRVEELLEHEDLLGCAGLTRGDIVCAWSFAHLMKARIEKVHSKSLAGEELSFDPLVIQSTGGFWNPLIDFLGLNDAPYNSMRRYMLNVRVTESLLETESLLNDYFNTTENVTRKADHYDVPLPFDILSGSVIYVASTKTKKREELRTLFRHRGLDVKVRHISDLMGTIEDAEELRITFEGNAEDKLEKAFEKWEKLGVKKQVRALEEQGVSIDKVFILTDDRGGWTKMSVVEEPEFSSAHPYVTPGKPTPGVELSYVTNAVQGLKNYSYLLDKVFNRWADEGVDVDRTGYSQTTTLIAPLAQEDYKKIKFEAFFARNERTYIANPRPYEDTITSDHYAVPIGCNRTEAELGDSFFLDLSTPAQCASGIQRAFKIPLKKGTDGKKAEANKGGFIVSDSQFGVVSEIHSNRVRSFNLHGSGYNIAPFRQSMTTLRDMQTFIEAGEGYLLEGFVNGHSFDTSRRKIEMLYMFFSLATEKALNNPFVKGRPIITFGNSDVLQMCKNIFMDLQNQGTIKEEPCMIYQDVVDKRKVSSSFKHGWEPEEFIRNPQPLAPYEDIELEDSGRYNVAFFGSASTRNPQLLNDAYEGAKQVAQLGMGVISGWGGTGAMGEFVRALVDLKRAGHDVWTSGVQVPHALEMEGVPEGAEEVGFKMHLARDIYQRMEMMIEKSDAVVLKPGGVGTIQEAAAVILWRIMEAERTGVDRPIPLIVENTQMELNGEMRGFYDELLAFFTPEERERFNIIETKNVQDTTTVLKKHQDDWKLEQEHAKQPESFIYPVMAECGGVAPPRIL